MQNNTHNMLEAVLFTKVNLINAAGGALLVVMFSVAGALQFYMLLAGSVSITALAIYNVVRAVRLLNKKEEEE